MPRKAAVPKEAAPAAEVGEDTAAAEASAPRRSGRTKPAAAVPAAPAPAKKPRAKRTAAKEEEEEDKEEPVAKKAKPASKAASVAAVEAEIKIDESPESLAPPPPAKASRGKPVSKASNAGGTKPVSKASNKPASRGKAPASKAATDEPMDTGDNDVEMEDKENVKADVKEAGAKAEAEVGELQVGDTLPAWTFKNEKDEDVNVAELAKEKGLVLFLVPKADTPGCTTQACGFRDSYADFTKYSYAVYCLSADSPAAQTKWQTKKTLPYSLISDPQRKLIHVLGAKSGASTKRSHFIFEKGTGKLVEKKLGVKPVDSPKQALDFIKTHHPETS